MDMGSQDEEKPFKSNMGWLEDSNAKSPINFGQFSQIKEELFKSPKVKTLLSNKKFRQSISFKQRMEEKSPDTRMHVYSPSPIKYARTS